MRKIYRKYFSKNKPFRHLSQHIIVGIIACFITYLIINTINFNLVFLFFLSTLLIDLDGVFAIFIFRRDEDFSKKIRSKIKSKDFKEAFYLASLEHKKLDKLILHNFPVFIILTIFWYISFRTRNLVAFYSLSGILSHMSFDIFDDIVNLGHVRHWLFG